MYICFHFHPFCLSILERKCKKWINKMDKSDLAHPATCKTMSTDFYKNHSRHVAEQSGCCDNSVLLHNPKGLQQWVLHQCN